MDVVTPFLDALQSLKKHSGTAVLLLAVFIVTGCEESDDKIKARIRPDNVPAAAVWIGGVDGGIYLTIEKSKSNKPGIYSSVIYYAAGEVDYQGELKINSTQSPDFEYKDTASYSGWDGDTLYLRDGRELKIFK